MCRSVLRTSEDILFPGTMHYMRVTAPSAAFFHAADSLRCSSTVVDRQQVTSAEVVSRALRSMRTQSIRFGVRRGKGEVQEDATSSEL